MKTTIKIVSFFALSLLAFAPLSRAAETDNPPAEQTHPRLQHMRENRIKRLDEKLHLTADQKTQIEAIWDKAEQEARAAHKDDTAAVDRKARRREMMQAIHQQVRAVLTPDQQKLFDEMPAGNPHKGSPALAPAPGTE